jgi:predicted metal-binding membrane protein
MSVAESPVRPAALRALACPRAVAFTCIAVLVAGGWAYLGLLLAGRYSGGLLAALCTPVDGPSGFLGFTITFAMWCAMALAMMLPTAAPMIMTYTDLAEAAAAKGERAASPLVLTAGYVAVWLGAALVLAVTQGLLAQARAFDELMSLSPLLAAALFLLAGAYQFSRLKHACLTQCQNPFRFFFANWTDQPAQLFRIGLRQGLYCLGCCWAMMLLMFAIGVMSVLWMVALGLVMAIEKIGVARRFSHAVGVLWLAVGAGIVVQHIW